MDRIFHFRETHYQQMRILAVFIISPILVCKGVHYKDNFLIVFGILLALWDGLKLLR